MESEDRGAIDISNVVPGRRLLASFQPQRWINDDAVDSDNPIMVDVTDAYLKLSLAERAAVEDNRKSSDDLLPVDVWKNHGGPGYVTVVDAIREFHAPRLTHLTMPPICKGQIIKHGYR